MDINQSKNIINLDEILKVHIAELKSQIEENELVYGINSNIISSLYIPKDPNYFAMERKLELQRLLNIPKEKYSKIIAESMLLELESCEKTEHTAKSMPFLINQYFVNRIEDLVVMKHSLMLRWKRYCITEDLRNNIQKEYNERLKTIEVEYKHLLNKTHRLKAVKEGYLFNTDQGIEEITTDDMVVYLKGFAVHLHSMRYMSQIIRVLQWISMKFRKQKKVDEHIETHSISKSEKTSRQDLYSESSYKSEMSKATSAKPSEKTHSLNYIEYSSAACGGGLAIDEKNLNMPLHTNNIQYFEHILRSHCQVYFIDMDIKNIRTSADEMELFSHVSRKFKIIFAIQEQMRTFKVYDKIDGGDRWGVDSSQHALLKPATWMSRNPFKPKINLIVSKYMNILQTQQLTDEFLKTAAAFIKKSNCEDTQNSLRHHALIIQHLPVVHNTGVVANPKGFSIGDIFKQIYNSSDFSVKVFVSDDNTKEDDTKEPDSYKFQETLQLLGLDDCIETKDDPSSVQGAYLSYLNLRFLKTRDLQRTCLSILNYFRSLERTLVINSYGFSCPDFLKFNKRNVSYKINSVFSRQNLGHHQYFHDNLDHFNIPKSDVMQFEGVLNHDDFYFHEDGRVHVKDQMNYWIVYDIAIKDYEELEEYLILVGSYYISMDKDYRLTSLFNRKRSQSENDIGASFITEYGHREVDKFGVFYDLWNQQTEFMQSKKKLVDMYMEVYNSIYKTEDRNTIAQIIINIIYQKPRLDITLSYFISSYRLESQILNQEKKILQKALDKEKNRYRSYMMKEYNSQQDGYMLLEKLLIHANSDESVLQPLYFLEFVQSLGMVTQVKKSLDFASSNLKIHSEVVTVLTELKRELEFLNFVETEITSHDIIIEDSFKTDLFEPLFSTSILDNPKTLMKISELYIKYIDSRNTRGEKKTRKCKLINEFGRFFDLLIVRCRLIDSLCESKYISYIYKNQAHHLGYNDFHMYMRLIPFESAKRRDLAETQKPLLYISSVQDDDDIIDKYLPNEDGLAIHELDNVHLGKISLSKVNNIIELLAFKGLEDLQLTLKVQCCQRNSLAVGILLCDTCRPSVYSLTDPNKLSSKIERTESTNVQMNVTYNIPVSLQTGPTPLALDKSRAKEMARYDFYPEAFFSLQLEKSMIRDKMLNSFLRKSENSSKLSSLELDKIKRENVIFFANSLVERISNAALKAQIISCYGSIINLLKRVPDIGSTFFQFGNDTKPEISLTDSQSNYDNDPRILRNRCRKVISDDGKLFNIWYIPHFTEILFLYRENDDIIVNKILKNLLRLVISFHDILHYVIGIWNLSFNDIKVTENLKTTVQKENEIKQETNCYNIVHQLHLDQKNAINVFTDYETTNHYQLQKELIDLENQIRNLKDPTNIEEVIDLLNVRKTYHYFYFDTFVTSVLPDSLLASNNQDIYDRLNRGIESTMILMNKIPSSTYVSQYLKIPLPLVSSEVNTKKLFPWRSLLDTEGPFIINLDIWINIVESIQLCFGEIQDKDRHMIKDQFYSFNLLIEEILLEHEIKNKPLKNESINEKDNDIFLLSTKFRKTDKKEVNITVESRRIDSENEAPPLQVPEHLSVIKNPIETYQLYIEYFIAFKRLTILKQVYCMKKLKISNLMLAKPYINSSKLYRREILFPLLRKLSHELGLPHLYYFGPTSGSDIIVYPKGVSLKFVNQRLTETLIEEIQKMKISEIQKRITTQLDKVIKERNYDGREIDSEYYSVLKKGYLKPNLSIDIAQKLEEPYKKLLSIEEESDDNEIERSFEEEDKTKLSKKQLNDCVQFFGNSIQYLQKETYESFAMYFENILKQQQRLLNEKSKIIKSLRDSLQNKEQSIYVQRQFILGENIANFIMEINKLRGKLKEKKKLDTRQTTLLKQNISLEYKFVVRNLYSLSFEQMTQMKISIHKFRCEFNRKINDTRIEASHEMNKIKEKSGAKKTADDDLLERNIAVNRQITKSREANFHVSMITSRMKSLYNWIYMHNFNVNDQKIESYVVASREHQDIVLQAEQAAQQRIKLLKCETKKLNETLQVANADLAGLRDTLNSEMNQKTDKYRTEEINALKVNEDINHKRKQINNMLELIKATNAKMATMQNLYNEYSANKETVAIKSHKTVGKLKRILGKERDLKHEAFMKVDDLISQVYEFEAAFAVVSDDVKPKVKQESTIESLSKPRNPTTKPGHPTINFDYSPPERAEPRTTYKTVVNQHCHPYTPCHYLPFRRDRLSLHKIRMNLKRTLQNEKDDKDKFPVLPKLKRMASFIPRRF